METPQLSGYEQEPGYNRMVREWEAQISARDYAEGTIVGDETMEALAASLGLDEQQHADAYLQAKSNVLDRRQQG